LKGTGEGYYFETLYLLLIFNILIMNKKITLNENEIPENYLNINFYLNKYLGKLPDPPLHPVTMKPVTADDLASIFPMELIKQEVSLDEKIPIPDEVREIYKTFRATPLYRAERLERSLDTPAHIYYKYEGASPVGSHKINTAIAQAFYNRQEKVETLVTETGAGQWGSALSLACRYFSLKCKVFMVRVSFDQKPYRRTIIRLYGGDVFASPSNTTEYGKKLLDCNPDHPGSLGIAISEALETLIQEKKAKYALGSVLNHVLLHQTVIGLEAVKQMEKTGEYPNIVIGCCGGGSNFAGLAFPFLAEGLKRKSMKVRFIGVEPKSCPTLTEGKYRYDYGDSAGLTPLLKMMTLGCGFVPSPIHAGGLRYHGIAPILAFLLNQKLIEARAYNQKVVFEAGVKFAQTEGIIPAPESAHAIKAAIDEAIICKKEGRKKVILFNLSGHGMLDLKGYESFLGGKF
jgi:tryptophan synthase beta chain